MHNEAKDVALGAANFQTEELFRWGIHKDAENLDILLRSRRYNKQAKVLWAFQTLCCLEDSPGREAKTLLWQNPNPSGTGLLRHP